MHNENAINNIDIFQQASLYTHLQQTDIVRDSGAYTS